MVQKRSNSGRYGFEAPEAQIRASNIWNLVVIIPRSSGTGCAGCYRAPHSVDYGKPGPQRICLNTSQGSTAVGFVIFGLCIYTLIWHPPLLWSQAGRCSSIETEMVHTMSELALSALDTNNHPFLRSQIAHCFQNRITHGR
jgi:hypothetical protein